MLTNYLNFDFDVKGKHITGFCMRIEDDFHETYAVIMEGYHSFCVWMDSNSTWKTSKYTNVEPVVLENILDRLSSNQKG
jgi:hypothetical protein